MALSVVRLKREYEIRLWQRIIEDNPYVAVVQSTGGGSWGRTNMKSRILGKHNRSDVVNARYAVPKAAHAGALRTRKFRNLSMLFKTASSAVIYGTRVEPVIDVVKQATNSLAGALLVGGRFGEDVVTAATWASVLDSEGETAEWIKLLSVLGHTPPFIPVLDQSSAGLLDAVRQSSRANNLVHILQQMGDGNGEGTNNNSEAQQEAPR